MCSKFHGDPCNSWDSWDISLWVKVVDRMTNWQIDKHYQATRTNNKTIKINSLEVALERSIFVSPQMALMVSPSLVILLHDALVITHWIWQNCSCKSWFFSEIQHTTCYFTVLCFLSILKKQMTSFISCWLEILSVFIHKILHEKKKKKGRPLKNRVTQSWLAIAATPISVNRLLPGRVTSALAPARHTERDISQHYSLSGYSYCGASGGGSQISW